MGSDSAEIHEIKPVIFDGSPTDLSNKAVLTEEAHEAVTRFWNGILRDILRLKE